MRTEVCITVDTEFSLGGALARPGAALPVGEPMVRCPVDGEDHGLGFLLDGFARAGLKATFFVEALNVAWFGDAPMATVAARILDSGHDVQLHLHPVWRTFRNPDWRARLADGRDRPNDSCAGRGEDELADLVAEGLAAFARWGVPRPVAVRAGNLSADRALFRAMARHGLGVSSNLGLALHRPADPTLHLHAGRHWIEGVLEVPVLSFAGTDPLGRRHLRALTVTGTSSRETVAVLWQARRLGISPVVVLTHPFEFVKARGGFDRLRRNRVNQERLVRLCRFLAGHDRDFATVTFAEAAAGWRARGPCADALLTVPPLAMLGRIVENQLNDHIWWY